MIHDMQTVYALQRLYTQADIAGEVMWRPGAMEGLATGLFRMLAEMGTAYGIDFAEQDAHIVRTGQDPARNTETYAMHWEPKTTAFGIRGTYRDGLRGEFRHAPHTPLRIPAPPLEIWEFNNDSTPTAAAEPITLECAGWDNIDRIWVYEERKA